MISYNHGRFITKAIESVLSQRTNFPIELVIGDDASSDDTGQRIEILRVKAPSVIRPIARSTNIGMHRNLEGVLEECHGEFIAFLEGDDYWTGEDKLQLQVEVLRANERAVGVFHPAVRVDALAKETLGIWPEKVSTVVETQELLEGNCLPTASVMIRRSTLVPLPDSYRKLKMRDWPMWVFASLHGPWLSLPQPMAVHRAHAGGSWTSLSQAARLDSTIEAYRLFAADLPRPYADVARRQLARTHLDALVHALDHGSAAELQRELREIVRLLSCYRVDDSKHLVSALLRFALPRTHSIAKRTLRGLRPRL
jgi:glycosyltransferase involved in cell wall biosynthesis